MVMIRTMGGSFRTVSLTVTGGAVSARGTISTSVTSRRYTHLAHLDPCDVLIASPLSLLMGLMIWWRSGGVRWVCLSVCMCMTSKQVEGPIITPGAGLMTLPYWFWHHLVGVRFRGWVLNQGDQSVTLFVSAGHRGPNCTSKSLTLLRLCQNLI